MRAILTALMLTVATQAGAECGNLCDYDWWSSATEADVQAELDAGADVMARNQWGRTPLHNAAAWSGTPATIQALLAAGADVIARNKNNTTPLHWAAKFGKPANIQALLSAGADAKGRDLASKTQWDYAQENEKVKGTKVYWALNDAQYN